MGMFGVRRDRHEPRKPEGRRRTVVTTTFTRLMPDQAGVKQWIAGRSCGGRCSGLSWGSCPGGGAHARLLRGLLPGEEGLPSTPREFGRGAIEGVAGARVGQQRRGPGLLHPAAHPRHPDERRHGPHARRHDHPRHPAGTADDRPSSPSSSGASSSRMWIGNVILLVLNLPMIGHLGPDALTCPTGSCTRPSSSSAASVFTA